MKRVLLYDSITHKSKQKRLLHLEKNKEDLMLQRRLENVGHGNKALNTKSDSGDLKTTNFFNQKATNMQMASVEIYWNQYCHYRGNYCSTLIQAPTSEGQGKYCTLHFLALLIHGKKVLKHSATFVLHTLASSCIQSSQTNVRLSPKRGKTPKTQNLKIARKLCKEKNRMTVLYKFQNI